MPTSQTDAAKKADNQRLRQTTLQPRHSLSQTGAQPGNQKTHNQLGALPTVEEAQNFLSESGYHKQSTQLTIDKLGEIIIKISEKTEQKHIIEGMRNVGVLLIEAGKEAMRHIMRGKKVEGAVKELKEEMAKTAQEQKQELEAVKKAADAASKESMKTINQIATGMEAIAEKMKAMEDNMKTRPQTQAQATNSDDRPTYASTAAKGMTLNSHARVMARGEEAEKQIVVYGKDKNKEMAAGLKTEAELIAKADMTIKLLEEEGEKPYVRVKFVGGFRAKTGAIIYTLNSKEAANWLKHADRLKKFNEKFGDSAQTHAKLFNVMAYYVPTTFNANSEFTRTDVELDNDLYPQTLVHTKYIKPENKRSKTQKSAHLILGFATREGANEAIAKKWLIIGEKRVMVKKLTTEPRRCYKCQSVKGDHTADKCPEKEPKCARCAGAHSTELCNTPENVRCVNCDSPNHGAGNRECPVFIRSVKEYTQRSPEGCYRFFPILGNTMSMELLDGSYGPDFTNRTTGYEKARRPEGQDNPQDEDEDEEEREINQHLAGKLGKLGPVVNWDQEMAARQNADERQNDHSIFN